MEAFWVLALLQLLELPDHLNRSKIAERQRNEPKATVDTRSGNQWGWDRLNAEAQAYSCRLDTSQQRAVSDLITRRITEVGYAPLRRTSLATTPRVS